NLVAKRFLERFKAIWDSDLRSIHIDISTLCREKMLSVCSVENVVFRAVSARFSKTRTCGYPQVLVLVEAAGIEPASRSPQTTPGPAVTGYTAQTLAQSLARDSQIDPDLARVMAAWPNLPATIRRAILALVESTG